MPTEELLVTQGAKMREMREKGVVLTFPSGNVYRVRIVGAAALLLRGNLPNILLAFVIDAIYHGVDEKKFDAFLALREREESAREFIDSLRAVCETMFMEPKVVADPKADDEVSIMDLSLSDQTWAFELAFGFVRQLRPFRQEQAADVGRVPRPEDVPQEAE
jgi:hypothetical protein